MSFVSPPLLQKAVHALPHKQHTIPVILLPSMIRAGVRVHASAAEGTPYGSDDENAVLREYFALPSAPADKPFLAVWQPKAKTGESAWVNADYGGSTLQAIRTNRWVKREKVFWQQKREKGKDLWGLRPNCGPDVKEETGPPVRIVDLAIWYGREWDVSDLDDLCARFLQTFPLGEDNLIGSVYSDDVPDEYRTIGLADAPMSQEDVVTVAVTYPPPTPESAIADQLDDQVDLPRAVDSVASLIERIEHGVAATGFQIGYFCPSPVSVKSGH